MGRDTRFDSVCLTTRKRASKKPATWSLWAIEKFVSWLVIPIYGTSKKRIEGYSQAMREAKLSKFEQIILTDVVEVEGKMRSLKPLASRDRPTAVLAATQLLTLAALKVISQLRISLPKDISLLAFDDSEWLTAMRRYISTVSQPADAFADEAWATLMTRLNKDRSPKLQRSTVRCTTAALQLFDSSGGRFPINRV